MQRRFVEQERPFLPIDELDEDSVAGHFEQSACFSNPSDLIEALEAGELSELDLDPDLG